MSYLAAYFPTIDRELTGVQLTLSLVITFLLLALASSIVTLHSAWLRNKAQHSVELGVLKRISPTLWELLARTGVCIVAIGSVMIAAWGLGGIDLPLSLPFVVGLSVAIAAWTKAWREAGEEKLLAMLDGRDALANWLEHHPGKPPVRRGSWRAYELMLQLPVDYTRHRVFSGCLAGVSFSLAWGFKAHGLDMFTTILIPAVLSIIALSGLVVALGLAVWGDYAINLRSESDQWQQQAEGIVGESVTVSPPSVYLGERSDLNEMFIQHPDRGVKGSDDGI